ncbi:MAG: type II toxin-antitoxin system HicA family toxin [Deltaproteobacteria bacterium]|nr:type II toxin-antitoxin system HicA family toxin [Deltaproteobacteria bacterium]
MPELRQISGAQTIAALERLGFVFARQRESHVIMKKLTADGAVGCVVPMHKRLAIGTLLGILKQAGVDKDEFLRQL